MSDVLHYYDMYGAAHDAVSEALFNSEVPYPPTDEGEERWLLLRRAMEGYSNMRLWGQEYDKALGFTTTRGRCV